MRSYIFITDLQKPAKYGPLIIETKAQLDNEVNISWSIFVHNLHNTTMKPNSSKDNFEHLARAAWANIYS